MPSHTPASTLPTSRPKTASDQALGTENRSRVAEAAWFTIDSLAPRMAFGWLLFGAWSGGRWLTAAWRDRTESATSES